MRKNSVKARKFKRGTINRYGSAGAFEVFSKPCNFHDIICMNCEGDGIFTRFDRKLLIEILSYFDESTVKMRLIDQKRGGVKMLQIQDSKTEGILMPMKDID